ncbi:hypothetical protein BN1708_015705 [Verticillium longisporum]|uniref:Uncharacterized protein n=1 Tax=Verticillium longisporum TaxID=100787 RepID=A0A0G4M6S6_VERLO|nr:hypothetical protein BN1708_015705 [Verticillium longisporum]
MAREVDKEMRHGIEIQRWDGDGSEPDTSKFWLEAESIPGIEQASVTLGIRSMIGEEETHFSEIVDRICQRKFSPFSLGSLEPSTLSLKSADSRTASSLERVSRERELFDRDNDTQSEESLPDGWQSSRNAEEEAFVARFAKTQSRVAVWAGNHIWWADDEVWQSRLRLLQLLGGTDDYNAATIRTSIESLPGELLVPEIIILDGRERRHEDAIRLLVHKLGDYDTAVSYCLRGGSSIYTPLSRGRKDSMPTHEMQARLFRAVLGEFLTIADVSERVEQTGALLERFGGWFEIDDILGLIPDGWSVDIVAGFLVRALRRLVQEKHESSVMKALSSAENLRVNHELIARVDEMGPTNEAAQ